MKTLGNKMFKNKIFIVKFFYSMLILLYDRMTRYVSSSLLCYSREKIEIKVLHYIYKIVNVITVIRGKIRYANFLMFKSFEPTY